MFKGKENEGYVENESVSFLAGRVKALVTKHFVLSYSFLEYPCEDNHAAGYLYQNCINTVPTRQMFEIARIKWQNRLSLCGSKISSASFHMKWVSSYSGNSPPFHYGYTKMASSYTAFIHVWSWPFHRTLTEIQALNFMASFGYKLNCVILINICSLWFPHLDDRLAYQQSDKMRLKGRQTSISIKPWCYGRRKEFDHGMFLD